MEKQTQDLEKLVELAKVVREACEFYTEKTECGPEDLGGLCHDASYALLRLAKKQGIDNVELGASPNHWFVLLNNMIVDITATQFGVSDKVSVLSLEETKAHWWQIEDRGDFPYEGFDCAVNDIIEIAEELLEQKFNPKSWAYLGECRV